VTYFLFALGIYCLIKGADLIIDSSSSLAKKFGISTMVVGLTVVAFGTSLPELIVNIFASLEGAEQVAFGSIVGSNISNILLALGVTAIVRNIKLKSATIWREIPFALLAAFVLFVFSNKVLFGVSNFNLYLTRFDGMIFLCLFGVFMYHIVRMARKDRTKVVNFGDRETIEGGWKILIKLVVGLVGIYFGGRWVVDGAVFMATQFGISEFLVSATIIALGTSLPELVVCVSAALKNKVDLAVGNIIGSNIFNILWVLGIVPFIRPILIPTFVSFDIAVMFFATLLLFIFMFTGKRHGLRRKDGIVFVLFYILYIVFLIWRG